MRLFVFISFLLCFIANLSGAIHNIVIADSLTRMPLPYASIFDCSGNFIGVSNSKGKTPYISQSDLPVMVRYMGYKETAVDNLSSDTIFLQENYFELPELVVATRQNRILHILGYVREYSTLTTYTDTVFLFREKMVDFMLPQEKKSKFKGWSRPRILTSKSYYRFTNTNGLDSVSDECQHHFSWSDWVGIAPEMEIPDVLKSKESGIDTLYGKYAASEIWKKGYDKIVVDINVLADTVGRKWVPNLSGFFHNDLEFESFRLHLSYDNPDGNHLFPSDLNGYSFNIESTGRGRSLFRFTHPNELFYVTTYAEVYLMEKEYITLKEAKKWEKHDFASDEIGIYEATEAPGLQPQILSLMDRVNKIDRDEIILAYKYDPRFKYERKANHNFEFGNRVLNLIKGMTGISAIKSHRNREKNWKRFRNDWMERKKSDP